MKVEEPWEKFSAAFGFQKIARKSIYQNIIIPNYSESHRHYHNLNHIKSCLSIFNDRVAQTTKDRKHIECAIWFHDLVYNPQEPDNEEKSAKIFLEIGNKYNLPKHIIDSVIELILATKHSEKIHKEKKFNYLLDIDLSILGSSKKTFDLYEENVRKEYSFVSDEIFKEGRKRFLNDMLKRPKIFQTKEFQDLEERARENMKNSKYY